MSCAPTGRSAEIYRGRGASRSDGPAKPEDRSQILPESAACIHERISQSFHLRRTCPRADSLALQLHRVRRGGHVSLGDRASTTLHGLIKRSAGNENIGEIAVEGLGGSPKRVQRNGARNLRFLEGDKGRLSHAHPRRELTRGHAECRPDCSHPPPGWAGRNFCRQSRPNSGVELSAAERRSSLKYSHKTFYGRPFPIGLRLSG
jgi:hypothetical protein